MSKRNSLMKNTVLYFIGNFGSKILNFILVPLYTYYISAEAMGTYDIYYTTATLFVPLVTLSISEAAYRWLLDEKSDSEIIIITTLRILGIGLGIFTVFYSFIYVIFKFDYAVFLYLLILFSSIYGTLANIVRGLKKNTIYAMMGVIQTFLILSLNILFLVFLKGEVKGLLSAQVLAYFILVAVIWIIIYPTIKLRKSLKSKDMHLQKQMICYACPLIPNSINWWITNLSDRYMIRWLLNSSANGIYSISCKFPNMIDTFVGLFNMAWQEDAICRSENGVNAEYFSRTFEKYYLFLTSTVACAIPVTYYYITIFMENSYRSAWMYTSILYLGTIFHALANYLSVGYNINKDTKWVTLTSFFAAITNILINLFFMKKWGLQIASISTTVSYIVIFIVRYLTTKKIFQLKINVFYFGAALLFTMVVCIISFLENDYLNLISFAISVSLFLHINKTLICNIIRKIVQRKA